MKLFLTYDKHLTLVNTYQALRVLNVDSDSTQEEIKSSYRKMALELHPDKNKNNSEDAEFKKITEAYHVLKNNKREQRFQRPNSPRSNYKKKPQWGAPNDGKIPEQDWSKFTKNFEDEDPNFWKEYEKQFWEDYNARVNPETKNQDFNTKESEKDIETFTDVDKSKCIACCSCETIAPDVFEINKNSMLNPKSKVINQKGASFSKIMNAAETCPTKAINVQNIQTKEKLFPH